MSDVETNRNDTEAFGGDGARHMRDLARRLGRNRLREGDDGVSPFGERELDVDHVIQSVLPEKAEDDNRNGKSDAERRQAGAERASRHVAENQDDPRG